MALQSSGEISLAQVQSEFGGSNPIEMSEYYRGGSYVPTTLGGAWTAWQGTLNSPTYYWMIDNWNGNASLYWNGSNVANPSVNATTTSAGGYEYEKGSLFNSVESKYQSLSFYYIRRRTQSATVNTGIPSSGTISMSDFYGGRKT